MFIFSQQQYTFTFIGDVFVLRCLVIALSLSCSIAKTPLEKVTVFVNLRGVPTSQQNTSNVFSY